MHTRKFSRKTCSSVYVIRKYECNFCFFFKQDKADLPPPPIDPSLISGTAPAMPAMLAMPPGSGEGPTSAPGKQYGE